MKNRPFILVMGALVLVMVIIFMVQRSFTQTQIQATSSQVEANPSSSTIELFPMVTETSAATATSPFVTPTNPVVTPTIYLIQLANKPDKAQQAQFIAALSQSLGRPVEVVYQYDTVFRGFAVKLTPAEVLKVSKMAGVRRVQPDVPRYPQEKENSTK